MLCRGPIQEHPENPLAGISHFHWEEDFTNYTAVYTRDEMFNFLKNGNEAYITDPDDPLRKARIYCSYGHAKNGDCYIFTKIHGQETNHLLNLVECKS